ncbi:DUF4352 domain-containing protein [Nucisporomicrobium flavum]|uniref:DUF4352 domain-containing protein n=1 Tax=Nucisporomicrobium flavum TaxID=2785915 RepID=UPI0018F40A5A|nr:DUF4352 domain-containing protein [Nucisporomicrobium flavum]
MSYQPPDPYQPQQPPVPQGYGPPPPGYPPQPGQAPYGPPPTKKSNKKLIFGIIGGVLVLCCGGGAIVAIAGDDDKTGASATTAPVAKDATTKADAQAATKAPAVKPTTEPVATRESGPGMGDPVRDGKFEFTVTKLDCSKSKVGSEYLNEKAQGKFCIISVTVKNIGKEAQIFDGSSQKAYDGGGTEFSNDTSAEIYANEGSPTFLQEINPGNQVKGRLIFDVPKSTKLTAIELHDSMFSGGVKVSLS